MFEWITEIDHGILLFIQEYLRLDWLTPFVKFYFQPGKCRVFLDFAVCRILMF